MDINDLTPQEKSELLAKARGWYQIDEEPIMGARWQEPGKPNNYWINPPNLYDPANMALALKCHFWAIYYAPSDELRSKYCQWFDLNTIWMEEEFQEIVLDSVLYIAHEAGLVAEEERG